MVSACSQVSEYQGTSIAINSPHPEMKTSSSHGTAIPAKASDQSLDPQQIRIPTIGVNAKIIKLGLNADQTLEVPEDFSQTGWWTGGSQPGATGPAVIVGHFDSKTGPAVFYHVPKLKQGNEIQILDAEGRMTRFKVDRLIKVKKDKFPTEAVYGQTGDRNPKVI